jgi:hypothetical protein
MQIFEQGCKLSQNLYTYPRDMNGIDAWIVIKHTYANRNTEHEHICVTERTSDFGTSVTGYIE